MVSIYDTFADSCTALAAKTKRSPTNFAFYSLRASGARLLQTAMARVKGRHQLLAPPATS